jgi:hypothetical protein
MVWDGYTAFFDRVFKLDMGAVLLVHRPAIIPQTLHDFPNCHNDYYTCNLHVYQVIFQRVFRIIAAFFAFLCFPAAWYPADSRAAPYRGQ